METSIEDVNSLTSYVNFILLDKLRITSKENFSSLCALHFAGYINLFDFEMRNETLTGTLL